MHTPSVSDVHDSSTYLTPCAIRDRSAPPPSLPRHSSDMASRTSRRTRASFDRDLTSTSSRRPCRSWCSGALSPPAPSRQRRRAERAGHGGRRRPCPRPLPRALEGVRPAPRRGRRAAGRRRRSRKSGSLDLVSRATRHLVHIDRRIFIACFLFVCSACVFRCAFGALFCFRLFFLHAFFSIGFDLRSARAGCVSFWSKQCEEWLSSWLSKRTTMLSQPVYVDASCTRDCGRRHHCRADNPSLFRLVRALGSGLVDLDAPERR